MSNHNANTITIPLSKNSKTRAGLYEAIIDACDSDLSHFNWTASGSRHIYAQRGRNPTLSLHRVIMERIVGSDGIKDMQIDHINGDTLDNRRSNLRIVTNGQNQQNSIIPQNNTSGYKGVSWNKRIQKWYAYINHNGKQRYLGYFESIEKAVEARRHAVTELHGEYARNNFD